MPKPRLFIVSLLALILCRSAAAQSSAPTLDYYKLVPGFVAETKNDNGFVSGFAGPNPWGEYTAYLMATNAKGQRTWRVEQYLSMRAGGTLQGSTMYLLEGTKRAVLIDTAQPSKNMPGVNDLKMVVQHLLGHENDGSVRSKPLDFVVANTHSHGDHTGENRLFSDRTLYYMDGDWPRNAPANYVPIREGGGATKNGTGMAVGEIDLGDRIIKAVAIPPHTPGSTGYLDAENRMLITGDAMGSAWPWLHWAAITEYVTAMDHVAAITANIPNIAVLPAHFYQIEAYGRRDGFLGGQYILDQQASAHGIVNGTMEGEPYFMVGPTAYWGGTGSAKLSYSLNRVDAPATKPVVNYRAVRIPGTSWKREFVRNPAQAKLFDIKSDFHLIRSATGEVLYLIKGSRAALLVGSGSGEPGLEEFIKRLAGDKPLEVVTLHNEPAQTGGLAQLSAAKVLKPRDKEVIELGADSAGQPVQVEVSAIGPDRIALLSVGDRLLIASDAAGIQGAPATWRTATDGRYDLVYTAVSDKWFTAPTEVAAKQ